MSVSDFAIQTPRVLFSMRTYEFLQPHVLSCHPLAVNLRPLGLLVFGDLKSVNRNQNAGFEKLIYNQATQFKEQSDWQKMLFLLQAPLCKSALLTFLERETPKCTCKPFLTAYMKASKQKFPYHMEGDRGIRGRSHSCDYGLKIISCVSISRKESPALGYRRQGSSVRLPQCENCFLRGIQAPHYDNFIIS